MRSHLTAVKKKGRCLSISESLLVIAMISVIAGFVLVNYAQGQHAVVRIKTATDFANYLQKARLDSMRRQVKEINQMAQVKVARRHGRNLRPRGDHRRQQPLGAEWTS